MISEVCYSFVFNLIGATKFFAFRTIELWLSKLALIFVEWGSF